MIPKVINQAWTQKAVKLYRQRQDDDINLEAFKIPNIFLRLSVSTLRRFRVHQNKTFRKEQIILYLTQYTL